jgi:hypothetical protein
MLARNHRLAEQICSPGFHFDAFQGLQSWQRNRLASTYSDLMAQPETQPACEFFLDELYGGLDFLKRDQDLDKVMPVMVRFLPGHALASLACAFELQALSLEFDIAMSRIIDQRGDRELDLAGYASAYRDCGDRPGREKQIILIRQLGVDLSNLVDKALVSYLVRLLRGPAHAAGFGELQHFLESGLASFRQLENRKSFVDTVYEREWTAMNRLFAGHARPYDVNSASGSAE